MVPTIGAFLLIVVDVDPKKTHPAWRRMGWFFVPFSFVSATSAGPGVFT